MRESLRARLLLWYGATLALVIALFGSAICYREWRSEIAELDALLAARAGALAGALEPAAQGTFDLALPKSLATEPLVPDHLLWTGAGEVIDRSSSWVTIPRPATAGATTREGRREFVVRASSGAWILTTLPTTDARAHVWSRAVTVLVTGLAALGLALAGGWWWVGRALAPVDRINQTARAMIDGDFAARVPVDRVDTELGQLARALNAAFDQLQASVERQRRFAADASHELRTPLTTISTEVQWALGRARSADDYRKSLEICDRNTSRMRGVVERLLALARDEAGVADDRRVPVALETVVRAVVADLAALAVERQVTVALDVEPAEVTGDPDRLTEAISNVVLNAICYNQPGGQVSVLLRRRDHLVELRVDDTGVGIAAEDLPRVFEPFFRADPARSREAGGAGLGLAVSRAIVTRQGGTIHCASTPGRGTTISIALGVSQELITTKGTKNTKDAFLKIQGF